MDIEAIMKKYRHGDIRADVLNPAVHHWNDLIDIHNAGGPKPPKEEHPYIKMDFSSMASLQKSIEGKSLGQIAYSLRMSGQKENGYLSNMSVLVKQNNPELFDVIWSKLPADHRTVLLSVGDMEDKTPLEHAIPFPKIFGMALDGLSVEQLVYVSLDTHSADGHTCGEPIAINLIFGGRKEHFESRDIWLKKFETLENGPDAFEKMMEHLQVRFTSADDRLQKTLMQATEKFPKLFGKVNTGRLFEGVRTRQTRNPSAEPSQ